LPGRWRGWAAEPAAVEQALKEALIPVAGFNSPYVVTVVETGRETVLFDTGTGGQLNDTAGLLGQNMRAAGLDPKATLVLAADMSGVGAQADTAGQQPRSAAMRPSRTRRGVAGVPRSGHCAAGLF